MCSIRAASLALLVWGCGPERGPRIPAAGHDTPVWGGSFRYADDDDIRTLDPAVGYDEVTWTAEHLVFNTLLDYDAEVHLVGSLAERWEVSPDGLLWTFHLRPGVRFHNGRLLVADDVLASWNRLLDPSLASPGADFFGQIEGAETVLAGEATQASGLAAPDPATVLVRLNQADPTFANSVAMLFAAVIPIEEVELRGDDWSRRPVGTGPFIVKEWLPDQRTTFVRNPDYWEEGLPYLDEVVHLARHSRSLQLLKLEAGELEEVNRLTAPDYLWIKRTPAWAPQLQEVSSIDTYGEMMNTELPPFDDVWFRRAVSAAIDREKLKKLRNGRQRPTVSWVPPPLEGNAEWETLDADERQAYRYQRHDPDLARECMEKAGYPDGYPEPIPYWTLNDEASRTTSQSIQQDLAGIGVQIEIKNTTFPAYLSATGSRHTVPMSYIAWVMDYPNPKNFLETKFHCKSRSDENTLNDSFYCNPEVDRLLDEAAAELDPVAAGKIYRAAQAIIAEDAPYAFEYHSTQLSVTQPYVRGFVLHPVWTRDMTHAWLDLPEGRPAP